MKRVAPAVVLLSLLAVAACGKDEPAPPAIPSWAKVAPEQIAEAKKHGVPVAFENALGMRFVLIPAGTFLMGGALSEQYPISYLDTETPHQVTLSQAFYIQTREVSNGIYRKKVSNHHVDITRDCLGKRQDWGSLPFDNDHHPVVQVSHGESVAFAAWLSARDNRVYLLPTESMWEYACRAGSRFMRPWVDSDSRHYANVGDDSLKGWIDDDPMWTKDRIGNPIATEALWFDGDDFHIGTAPTGTFRANRWGLYDMLGNVSEWCADWYGPYPTTAATDPTGVSQSASRSPKFRYVGLGPRPATPPPMDGAEPEPMRVTRGRCWCSGPWSVRTAARGANKPRRKWVCVGFRLVSPLPRSGE